MLLGILQDFVSFRFIDYNKPSFEPCKLYRLRTSFENLNLLSCIRTASKFSKKFHFELTRCLEFTSSLRKV